MQITSLGLSDNLQVSSLFSQSSYRIQQVSYYELKDFQCFRALLPLYQVSVLKQVLPFFVKRHNKQSYDFQNYYYISDTNKQAYKAGNFIKSQKEIHSNCRIYAVNINDWFILQNLYFLKIKALSNMKLAEKTQFYRQCQKKSLKFNELLYNQEDKLQGIYYIIKGQIKQQQLILQACKDKKEKKICVKMAGYFLGVQDIVAGNSVHKHTAYSNCNQCLVLCINIMSLHKYFHIDIASKPTSELSNFVDSAKIHDQFYQPKRSYQIKKQFLIQENQIILQFVDFIKRFEDLNVSRRLTDNDGFRKYIHNKKLVLRMKQSNESSKQKLARCKEQTNIFEIRNMLKGTKYSKKKIHLKKIVNKPLQTIVILPRQNLLTAKLNHQFLSGKQKHQSLDLFQ